jgi:cytochrome c556
MRLAVLPLTLALVLGATTASAQSKPEDAIKYRQSLYTVMLWNWMPMNAMMRGRIPFDGQEFARRAALVASIPPQLLEGFPEGSHEGAKTEAKPEIWADFADFSAKMKDLEHESAALAEISRAGDEAAIKEQFAKTGGTCKACHDQYKVD